MDRGPDRRPPIPPEDRYGSSRGQSYRPNRSPPPPRGGYRPRSPPPRGYNSADTYAPARGPPLRHRSRSPPFRRRSRSPPPFRGRDGDGMRPRPRSPPRRVFDRDRDLGYRGPPPRDMRDEPRFRDRSPPPPGRIPSDRSPLPLKRSRDASPSSSRGRFSPPPAKRERLVSPARSRFSDHSGPRDRSPPRHMQSPMRERRLSPPRGLSRGYPPGPRSPLRAAERMDPRAMDNWRRRSPSPRRPEARSGTDSGRDSGQTSRRASPPVHPSRLAAIEVIPRDNPAPGRPSQRAPSPKPRSPPRRPATPPPKDRETAPRPGYGPPGDFHERQPPSGPSTQGASRPATDASTSGSRPPPSGPKPTVVVPPSAPRAAVPSAPAAPRGEMPSGPRGGRGGGFPPVSYRGRGGYPSGGREYESPTGPPSGPRSAGPPSGPFRSPSTPTVPTHPRAQRFVPTGPALTTSPSMAGRKIPHPHLASLPPILDEGKKLPDLFDRSNLDKLERQTEEIRKVLEEKQSKKRRGLREWEKAENEVKLAELRANLAEESLIAISGGGGGAATF